MRPKNWTHSKTLLYSFKTLNLNHGLDLLEHFEIPLEVMPFWVYSLDKLKPKLLYQQIIKVLWLLLNFGEHFFEVLKIAFGLFVTLPALKLDDQVPPKFQHLSNIPKQSQNPAVPPILMDPFCETQTNHCIEPPKVPTTADPGTLFVHPIPKIFNLFTITHKFNLPRFQTDQPYQENPKPNPGPL